MRPLHALPDAAPTEVKVHDRPSILPKPDGRPKIAILIVAYNAVSTLSQVLDRIPKEVWDHALGRLSPNLFAYQHIFVLTADA